MNDEQLMQLADSVDLKLVEWATVNQLSPVEIAGVILARLLILNRMSKTEDVYLTLLNKLSTEAKTLLPEKKVMH